MSKREKLIKEIETMSEYRLDEVDRYVESLKSRYYPDHSPEQLDEAYRKLTETVSKLPPIEIDLKQAKADYFEGKYGRIN